jgi:AAA15 family ATPase/GTPase
MTTKIISLQAENVKRVKAIALSPAATGLTVIGGRNGQGKTSVLDAIAWALGGDKFRPSEPRRDGSVAPPALHIELSNGLIVERKGKNSDLKVIDPSGNKGGQQLLDSFVEKLALNLPKFMEASSKDKAKTLLEIIGVGEKLYELDDQEARLYNQRTEIGRIADQKAKAAAEMDSYPDAPEEPVSASELIKQQQDILARNGEKQRKREEADRYNRELTEAQLAFDKAKSRLAEAEQNAMDANNSAANLRDESTEELEQNIAAVDKINHKVRVNLDKKNTEDEAAEYQAQYDTLTEDIKRIRDEKFALLDGAELPLEGLSVEEGELTYKGYKWDNMSGSDQLKVSTAIVRKLNPECGFVLLDKLEQMDLETLSEFGAWIEAEGLQAIATRVSTGDECQIIITDGYVQGQEAPETATAPAEGGTDISWT